MLDGPNLFSAARSPIQPSASITLAANREVEEHKRKERKEKKRALLLSLANHLH